MQAKCCCISNEEVLAGFLVVVYFSDSPQPRGCLPAAEGPLQAEPLGPRTALGGAGGWGGGGWQGAVDYYLNTCTLQSTLSVCVVLLTVEE